MPMNPRLLRPTASGFSPRSIAGLAAWYAADVASSISLDVNSKVEAWFAEWMIYTRVLSATEAESVRKYLGGKWNIPFKV